MNILGKTAIIAGISMSAVACSSLPERVDTLEQARNNVRTTERDPLADRVAADELAAAREALEDADAAYQDKGSLEYIEHKAYMAQRYSEIAEQKIAEERAKEQIAQGEAERNRVLLAAREREVAAAERQNQIAQTEIERNEQLLDERARQAELAQEETALAQQRNEELAQELADLQAEETERGLVLTLGDVLFDTNEASLKAGAGSTVDRLAQFMREYPERNVLIEGHTDARGSEEYNRELSAERAEAVRMALLERGVEGARISATGAGEAFPVATNETTAGMQQNRRVEIVISDESGDFPGAAQRSASASL